MAAACPLCGAQFPESELELHVNRCLDSQQAQEDGKIAATIGNGRDEAVASVTVPYRPQPWVSVRQPDPDLEEAIKRALAPPPPVIHLPAPPAPPPAISVPLPPTPAPAVSPAVPKAKVVFDADASNGWVESVRSEIKQKEEFTKSIISSMESTPVLWSKSSQVDRLKLTPIQGDLLDDNIKSQLMKYVPNRYRSGPCSMLYSTRKHGISINTFYAKVKPATATLLLIEDWNHWVFGAYISEPWKSSVKSFYGTGESFLFTARPKVEVFEWSRINDHFVLNDDTQISIGGGGEGAGIWIDADFFHGTSKPSGTFLNKVLSSTQDFECLSLEVWGLRAYK